MLFLKNESLENNLSNDPETKNSTTCLKPARPTPPIDGVGAFLSGLCVAHCLLIPFFASTIPLSHAMMGGNHSHNYFHWFMAVLIVPIGLSAFLQGYKTHHSKGPLFIGSTGILFLLLGVILTAHAESANLYLTLFGSVLLIIAHGINWKLGGLKQASCSHPH